MTRRRPRVPFALVALLVVTACGGKVTEKKHRERTLARDADCRAPERPHAYFYPAEDRTHYGPDDPFADKCELLVPDHLFCCPSAPRPTDR